MPGKFNAERARAKADGAVVYNTGKPCKWGHLSDRYTNSATCAQCCHEKWIASRKTSRPYVMRPEVVRAGRPITRTVKVEPKPWLIDPHELVTWGGPYPSLAAAKWRK